MATYSETPVSLTTISVTNVTTYTVPAGKYARVSVSITAGAPPPELTINGVQVSERQSTGEAQVPFIIYAHSGDVLASTTGVAILLRAQEFSNP